MMENKKVYQKKLVSMPGYIAQSLVMVLGMAVLFGFFSSRFIGISDTVMTIKLILSFLTAGVVITVVVIVRNYSRFIKPINEISNYADALYNKNLTYEIDMKKSGGQKPVCGQLKVAGEILSEAISNTKSLLKDSMAGMDTVNDQCDSLSKTNTEIVMAINCVAKEVEKNVETISNAQARIKGMDTGVSEFMDDLEVTVKGLNKTVDLSKEGDRNVAALKESTLESETGLQMVIDDTSALKEKMEKITEIVDVILGIMERTKLLAFNAAIESARAGESGKGFAVVADEIRKLAVQSAESVSTINAITSEIRNDAEKTVNTVNTAVEKFKRQYAAVDVTNKSFNSITREVMEAGRKVNQLNAAISEISTQKNLLRDDIHITSDVAGAISALTEELLASIETQDESIKIVRNNATALRDKLGNVNGMIQSLKCKEDLMNDR